MNDKDRIADLQRALQKEKDHRTQDGLITIFALIWIGGGLILTTFTENMILSFAVSLAVGAIFHTAANRKTKN